METEETKKRALHVDECLQEVKEECMNKIARAACTQPRNIEGISAHQLWTTIRKCILQCAYQTKNKEQKNERQERNGKRASMHNLLPRLECICKRIENYIFYLFNLIKWYVVISRFICGISHHLFMTKKKFR